MAGILPATSMESAVVIAARAAGGTIDREPVNELSILGIRLFGA